MKDYIMFNLSEHAPKGYPDQHPEITLYEQIKKGLKTSEWRANSLRWRNLLFGKDLSYNILANSDLTEYLRTKKAWFVHGYPKDSLPRIEAEITELKYWPYRNVFEIKIANPIELTIVIKKSESE